LNWAVENKMTVNLLKMVEIIFHRPNVSHDLLPSVTLNVGRVAVAKLLAVYLRHDLNSSQHVESVVATCNQRLYLLAQVKNKVLAYLQLTVYSKPLFLNKILYALPVFFGHLTDGPKHTLRECCIEPVVEASCLNITISTH